MLKIENLCKVYRVGTFGGKELHAVSDVSFDVHDGEVVSLIGESGSGKSTIGKMILRLISITSGKITFNGVDISNYEQKNIREYYRKVQGVFQDPFSSYNPIFKADRIFSILREEFYPETSNEEWDQRVRNALVAVGLNPDHCMCKYPHQLSGGQLQRFLIARALLLDIEFLVADEIISMLDASTRIDVLNLLADLKAHGLSILFITHDLSLAHYISERAVILYRGRVVEIGSTDKIFDQPKHPYTQMLMASVPRLDRKWDPIILDQNGKRPKPQSCVYYDRCPYADDVCAGGTPAMIQVEDDHFVACTRYLSAE